MIIMLTAMLAFGSFAPIDGLDAFYVGVYGRVIFDDTNGNFITVKWYDENMNQLGDTEYVTTSGGDYNISIPTCDPGDNCKILAECIFRQILPLVPV